MLVSVIVAAGVSAANFNYPAQSAFCFIQIAAQTAKQFPVILTQPEEIKRWLTGPAEEALKLQRPLDDGELRIVAKGDKEDGGN